VAIVSQTIQTSPSAEPAPGPGLAPLGRALPSGRLPHLDVVRGIAILLVLCAHTPAVIRIHPAVDFFFDHLHETGGIGVDLFFVLSGFLIGGLLFAELAKKATIDVGRFLVRRAFKIWPAYLICLTITCLAAAAARGQDLAGNPHPFRTVFAEMWPAYLHIQNYCPSTTRFAVFWSLGVEEHFYLLLPGVLLLLCARKAATTGEQQSAASRTAWLAVGAGAVCLVLRGITRAINPDMDNAYAHYFPTHLRIDSLLAGVSLAAAARFAPNGLDRFRPWRWLLALIALGSLFLPLLFPDGSYKSVYPFDCTIVMLGSVCAVLLAYFADHPQASGSASGRGRTWVGLFFVRILAFVGVYSYSIYLWHGYFGPPFSKRLLDAAHVSIGGTGMSTLLHLAVYLGVAVALGVIASWLIERPFLALRDRLFPSRQAIKSSAASGSKA
jgi:peptidoglycan/LPS O-acetylase OafA/YrhL